MSQWNELLSHEQLDSLFALTSKLDPSFAISERQFYATRSVAQLRSLSAGAWDAHEPHAYQIARSYLALHKES